MTGIDALRHAQKVARGFADACAGLLELMEGLQPKPGVLAPAVAQIAEPRKVRKPARKKARKPIFRFQKPSPAEEDGEKPLTPLRATILEIIRKSPCSSRELFEELRKKGLGTSQDSVYQTCSEMKKARLMETHVSESDGQRRWHLIGEAA